MASNDLRWHFWIDRGGTFTDVVARRPDGELVTLKLLSENPAQYDDAALAGIRALMNLPPNAHIPAASIAVVKMGTTVATNALLERKGEPTVLAITRGFRDQLRIAYQNRPRIFERHIRLPELLYGEVVEIDERMGARGEVVEPLDEARAREALSAARGRGFTAIAIVLMHGYRFPAHESRVAELAREAGFAQISVSHQVSPMMKIVPRGDTTVVDAYLSPVLRRYVDRVADALAGARLMFMQSSGGLADARHFQGKDAILSGPAGGIVGMAHTAAAAGFGKVIGFDMGGTSTDVSHYAGELERDFDTQVAGVRMRAPMMSIHTIAAGGGSILHYDGQRFRVGPDSAGAYPGPACYRHGGPLTVSDCNVMLGKLQPEWFPRVFGPGADQPLDAAVVREKFQALATAVEAATGQPRTSEDVAEGFVRVAVANMGNAIKFVSVQRGHDVTGYVLNCFGGAGGQHACLVADELGMDTVYVHPFAGVLSAYGIGLADTSVIREQAMEIALDEEALPRIADQFERLAEAARDSLAHQDFVDEDIVVKERLHLRYRGTDTALVVDRADLPTMRATFEAAYRRRFSFHIPERSLIVEAVSCEALGLARAPADRPSATLMPSPVDPPTPVARSVLFSGARWHDAPIYARDGLLPGQRIIGPAIIAERNATTIVEPGWRAEVTPVNHLVLRRAQPRSRVIAGKAVDPVLLEVFNNLFMSIAEQMGLTLANTAHSVNIKERLDFSCAVFDAMGNLIANAPHMPVHLGSMGESVKTIVRRNAGNMRPGDAWALNDPFHGGTHLPDVTVVTPVFPAGSKAPMFYVGSRGHHADIGGITPGSMPPFSRTVEEEGVLLDNVKVAENGLLREAEFRRLLATARHPARNPDQNLADLRAQIAANEKGARELLRMVDEFGVDTVVAYMGHVQDNAEESVRRIIATLQDGSFAYEMDNGAVIRVAVRVNREARRAAIDFTGTSDQLASNFNAPAAVVHAAVLYVFRTLVDSDIPLNAGCLKPLTILIPAGSMLNPRAPAATVAGNVETSQCITDALYGALGIMAASAGTMNNLTFGNERYQYYETVAGGSGAGPGFPGCDAVQTHMTNSRLTDPEVLEWRYPVRVEQHTIRRGSGGAGRWRGGDGAVRRIRFLEPMTAAILSGRRRVANFGMAGGAPGALGRTTIERAAGGVDVLEYSDETRVETGDALVLETPGGGGYGPAE